MGVEHTSVRLLAARFGKIPLETRAKLRPALKAAGNVVAAQAELNASYSTRIPGAIKVSSRLTSSGGVYIKVDAKRAPHARALEGTQRNSTFRHPVFGDRDVWVEQRTRPFLFPAIAQKKAEALAAIAAAVKSATKL